MGDTVPDDKATHNNDHNRAAVFFHTFRHMNVVRAMHGLPGSLLSHRSKCMHAEFQSANSRFDILGNSTSEFFSLWQRIRLDCCSSSLPLLVVAASAMCYRWPSAECRPNERSCSNARMTISREKKIALVSGSRDWNTWIYVQSLFA